MNSYSLIKNKIKEINLHEHDFNIKSSKITKQKENLNKEYVFFRKKLRDSQSIFRENMLQLNNIIDPIQNFSKKIEEYDKNYHKYLEELNIYEAFNQLSLYIENVKKFVFIISEVEKIETHLFITIKNHVQKLVDNFKLKKSELKTSFDHIDFNDNIKKIHKNFLEAKDEYIKLNFNQTKLKIKQIYKTIKSIENLINYEVICRNIFIHKKDLIMEETKKIFKEYKAIKLKIVKLVEEGKKFSQTIEENIMQLKNQANKVKNSAKSFENCIKNKNIPYSSKLKRTKDLLNNVNILIKLMNKTLEDI
jgi:methyl-accepting chemotaxis protein